MRKQFLSIVAAFGIAAVTSLFVSAGAKADAVCGTESLKGGYVYSADGYLTQAAPFTPIAEAGVYTFDGVGGFSTVNTISVGGQIIPRTQTGTYVVDADCTGSASITGGATFNFAIARAAKSIRLIVTTAGVVVSGTMEKQ